MNNKNSAALNFSIFCTTDSHTCPTIQAHNIPTMLLCILTGRQQIQRSVIPTPSSKKQLLISLKLLYFIDVKLVTFRVLCILCSSYTYSTVFQSSPRNHAILAMPVQRSHERYPLSPLVCRTDKFMNVKQCQKPQHV